MTKLSKNLWGRFRFQDRGILPSKRLIILLLIASAMLIVLSFYLQISLWFTVFINLFILLSSLFDLLLSPRRHQLLFERQVAEELERGVPCEINIMIRNQSNKGCSFSIVDGLPQSFKRPFPLVGFIDGEKTLNAQYETIASIRGKYEISKLYVRYRSFLGLWEKQVSPKVETIIKVIPDLTETRSLLEDAQKYLLYEGLKIRRQQRGVGDFAQIRSYVVGDDPRKINWRQTAKLQQVMTNEYEPEHGKYITILIDCGRMMGAELTKGNRLERVLEAVHTVAAAALQHDDYVSVLAFSKDVKVYIPAAKGMAHLQTILHSLYDLKVDPAESNYEAVFSFLEKMQKKRSLLLLFSDIHTFLHEENTLVYLQKLRQRHFFLMIGIEDMTLINHVKKNPTTIENTMVKSIAQQQVMFKKREKNRWEKQGLMMIEAREEKLAQTAVSYYIDIMNRNVL